MVRIEIKGKVQVVFFNCRDTVFPASYSTKSPWQMSEIGHFDIIQNFRKA